MRPADVEGLGNRNPGTADNRTLGRFPSLEFYEEVLFYYRYVVMNQLHLPAKLRQSTSCATASLCVDGPCKYALKTRFQKFEEELALVLALRLVLACLDDEMEAHMLAGVRNRIRAEYRDYATT
jgi:hypothetical protein